MSVGQTQRIMDGYWSEHDPDAVAPDAEFVDLTSGQRWSGREEISGMLRFMYEEAFQAEFIPEHNHIGDGSTAEEGRFVGRHVGEFGGLREPVWMLTCLLPFSTRSKIVGLPRVEFGSCSRPSSNKSPGTPIRK